MNQLNWVCVVVSFSCIFVYLVYFLKYYREVHRNYQIPREPTQLIPEHHSKVTE